MPGVGVLVGWAGIAPLGEHAVARWRNQDVVFEIKYATYASVASTRINDALMQLDRGVRAVKASGKARAYGVAIVVIPDETDDSKLKDLVVYANAMNSFENIRRVLVMRYADFLSLSPDDLVSRLFGDSGPSGMA
jgi:hypothetical protein